MKKLKIYCDAGSYNNGMKDPNKPMFGSYGCIIVKDNEIVYEFKDWFENITNNQGELFGFIKGYTEFLKRYRSKEKYEIEVISDSQYLIHGVNQYLSGWKKKGWKNSSKETVKNKNMWVIIDKLINYEPNVKLIFTWQKGHKGKKVSKEEDPNIYFNEYCDSLATSEIEYCTSENNTYICPEGEFSAILGKIEKILKIN